MDFSIVNDGERWQHFWSDVTLVLPEIWLTVAMCAVILLPLILRKWDMKPPMIAALVGLGFAFFSLVAPVGRVFIDQQWKLESTVNVNEAVFAGMLAIDPFAQFFKVLLVLFTALVIGQWWLAKRDRSGPLDTPDFLCLLLGAAFGMMLMASANNLLMIVVATEAASLPSFALAGFRKYTRKGTEGAMKYVIFGAASSAIMIYGMSLIYGATGSLDLATVANVAAEQGLATGDTRYPLFAVGLMAMLAGLAFKLSAVPMHFWCPDVFEAAPIGVTTFLSVASKGAAVILLVRVLHALGMAGGGEIFGGVAIGVAILGGITATWGNLLAFHQNNFKRLLAYSSIAHAGYMIMGAAVIVWPGEGVATNVSAAVLFYLMVYLFMNLGAFTVIALVAERTGSEDVRDYAGLIRRSPALTIFLILFLLSLFGMPGLGGFLGKVFIMKAMVSISGGIFLIAVLLINTLISLYYYMRPVYYMVFVPDEEERPTIALSSMTAFAMLLLCAVALLWTGLNLFNASKMTESKTVYAPKRPITQPAEPADEGEGNTTPTPAAADADAKLGDVKGAE